MTTVAPDPELQQKMTLLSKWIDTAFSALSGIVLGVVFGYFGPIILALTMGNDPIHRGHYGDWINVLIIVLPLIFGAFLVASVWIGRWRGVRRTAQGLALIAGFWQLYLMAT